MEDIKPFITEISDVPNIFNSKNNFVDSIYQSLPLLNLGFHTFIHQNKDKMSDPKLQQSKFYLVTNKFEHIINNSKEDLKTISEKYFETGKDKPHILSRAFFKLWEIMMYFELIDSKDFLSAHLAEGPGSFIQAVMFYREMFYKSDFKKDHYCAITLHSEDKSVPKFKKHFMDCYTSIKKPKFIQHKTYSKEKALEDNHKDDGDLTNLNTIINFKKTIDKTKKLANLVTADGGFVWTNENYQEQEAYRMILGEIISALKVQAKGGHFVLKIFETFTNVTLKYICILKSVYNQVFLCKPLTSRPSNSEKYIVCKGFQLEGKAKNDILSKLEDLLNRINNSKNFILDIFPDYKLPQTLKKSVLNMNIILSNQQYREINKIIEYKDSGNYFGDVYHTYKQEQIDANKWWINTFYPNKSTDLSNTIKNVKKLFS